MWLRGKVDWVGFRANVRRQKSSKVVIGIVWMLYLGAGNQSNGSSNRSEPVEPEGITMPRTTRRPLDGRARARLRDAQRLESDAVALVHAASIDRERTRAKLDAVIAKHQVAIGEADNAVSKAQSQLVSVSGIERAALLLEEPVAALRAAVRSATGPARGEPS
jgi:hypothetical protein